jgi:hypothetical protein
MSALKNKNKINKTITGRKQIGLLLTLGVRSSLFESSLPELEFILYSIINNSIIIFKQIDKLSSLAFGSGDSQAKLRKLIILYLFFAFYS